MKRAYFVCLFLCLTTTFLLSQSNPVPLVDQTARVVAPISASRADPKAQAKIFDGYGKLPLSFEANHGQTDARVKFLSRTSGYSLFLTGDEAVLMMRGKKAKKNSPQGLKPASLAGSGGRAEQAKEQLRFVSGYRFSDTVSSPKSETPLGAGHRTPTSSAASEAVPFPRTASAPEPTTESAAGGVLRMKLRNANPAAKVTGTDELAGTSNYFIGNDPAKWRTNVPTYAKVKYEGIYSGIDLVYYGNQHQLEYDFIVAPGADPRRIAFDVRGAKRIRRDAHGDLVLKTGEGEIRWHKPVVYQEKDGTRQLVAAHYAITDTNRVAFELAKYDASRALYIDPLIYSTYLGGSGGDYGVGIAVDSAGNAYVTGYTGSTDFPTKNPLQAANAGGYYGDDVFVAKLNPSGSALVYSTYLGGSGDDGGDRIAVDSAGNAYVIGSTSSTDFPTMNPLQPANAGGQHGWDAFVAVLNPTGSALVYSTYLGGSGDDHGIGIAVDSLSNAYVIGMTVSTDFPTTPGAFQTTCNPGNNCADVFVTKINPTGSALVYSTYLGGSSLDGYNFRKALDIAVDSAGNAYVTGQTYSIDFPTTPGAFQTVYGGGGDVFVSKFNPTGSALVYSTYLGGSGTDYGVGIAVDNAGDVYVTGTTNSTDFPTTPGAFQTLCNGGPFCYNWGDAFVSKLNPTGSALVYSTYLGGLGADYGDGVAVDSAGNAYVTGLTASAPNYPDNFPVTPDAFQTTCKPTKACADAFVTKINPAGSGLVYSTFLGGSGGEAGSGIAVDSSGNAYVTGNTYSTDFPTKNPLQATSGGSTDAFVAKIDVRAVPTITLSSSPNPSTYGQAVTLTAALTSSIGAPPDGETIAFMKTKVLGTGALSGGSASFTTSTLPVGSNNIKAVYSGDSNFPGSTSKTVKQVVSKATTTTTLVSSQNPSNFGQAVTFTASLAPQFSGTVTGKVTFYDGTTTLKTVALIGGAVKYTTKTLASGTHTITATYNGSTSFTGSSASLTQTVD